MRCDAMRDTLDYDALVFPRIFSIRFGSVVRRFDATNALHD